MEHKHVWRKIGVAQIKEDKTRVRTWKCSCGKTKTSERKPKIKQ